MRSLFIFLLSVSLSAKAATVDTVSIYSDAMHKSSKCVVIKPEGYSKKGKQFPVVYLLHGYSGKYSNWITKVPSIKEDADRYQLMIVCPDGGYSSWYFDSPVDPTSKYETYVGVEVPAYIDAHYKTIKNRTARAITGLSMGGHGGMFLGFRHASTFGACGGISGGMDIRPFKKSWDLLKVIGDSATHAADWENLSVINVVEHKPTDSLAIIFDCGTSDFFYDVNKALHEKLLRLNIPHDYIERPGQHDWNYWNNAVGYQLLYFKRYFDKMRK